MDKKEDLLSRGVEAHRDRYKTNVLCARDKPTGCLDGRTIPYGLVPPMGSVHAVWMWAVSADHPLGGYGAKSTQHVCGEYPFNIIWIAWVQLRAVGYHMQHSRHCEAKGDELIDHPLGQDASVVHLLKENSRGLARVVKRDISSETRWRGRSGPSLRLDLPDPVLAEQADLPGFELAPETSTHESVVVALETKDSQILVGVVTMVAVNVVDLDVPTGAVMTHTANPIAVEQDA